MSGEHLTDLTTNWTTITSAHTPGPVGQKAMLELVSRYHDAVERYLRLKLRDRHLADEVFQEFWTKLLTHKLAGADKQKGRFRDYVRTVLHRLIIDHFRTRKLQSLPLSGLLDPARAPDKDYVFRVWRRSRAQCGSNPGSSLTRRIPPRTATRRSSGSGSIIPRRPSKNSLRCSAFEDAPSSPSVCQKRFRKPSSGQNQEVPRISSSSSSEETIHPNEPADIEAEIYDLGLGHLYQRHSTESGR